MTTTTTINGESHEIVRVSRTIFNQRLQDLEEAKARIVELETALEGMTDTERDELEGEIERLNRQKRYLSAQLRQKTLSAVLNYSKDAILLLGYQIQEWVINGDANTDARWKVELAMRVLGARSYGEEFVGDTVNFDPFSHHYRDEKNTPHTGTKVKVIAPGIEFFNCVDQPFPLMRIEVGPAS